MSETNNLPPTAEYSSSDEHFEDRILKNYKTEPKGVNINQITDITDVALQKYRELKDNYNFVSFEESEQNKKVVSGQYEKY
jgi:hypothetical protein